VSLRVAILDSSSDVLTAIPWDEPGVEFWASVALRRRHPQLSDRVDCWFGLQPGIERLNPEWFGWALETQPRCFLRDRHGDLTRSLPYPMEIVAERFGSYFTSAAAYMLALAVEQGAEWIGLYGVDMAIHGQYLHQRACCEYLVGMARGMGAEVEIPGETPTLRVRCSDTYESSRAQEQDWCFVPDVTGYMKREGTA